MYKTQSCNKSELFLKGQPSAGSTEQRSGGGGVRCAHCALGGRMGLGRIYYHTLSLSVLGAAFNHGKSTLKSSVLMSDKHVLKRELARHKKFVMSGDVRALRPFQLAQKFKKSELRRNTQK